MRCGVVIFAHDLDRLSVFYAAVTGLAVSHAEPGHVELGDDLMLVQVGEEYAGTVISEPPLLRVDAAVKPVFDVADIEAVRAIIVDLGGGLSPADREWQTRDRTVCDGHDPEGNVIQLRQVG